LRTNQESTGAGRCHPHDAFHGTSSSYGAADDANYKFQVSTANAIGITEYQYFPLRNAGYDRREIEEEQGMGFCDSMELEAAVGVDGFLFRDVGVKVGSEGALNEGVLVELVEDAGTADGADDG
jgi:hypothetical protein